MSKIKEEIEEKQSRSVKYLIFCTLSGNLLLLTVGMNESWSSPVLPKLLSTGNENPFDELITAMDHSWIGALLSLGATFGPFFAAILMDIFGRKTTCLILGIPLVASNLMMAFSTNVIFFYIGRTFGGLSVGATFSVIPTYMAEISEDRYRGKVGSSMYMFETGGMLLTYAIGPYVSIMWLNIICAIVGCSFIILYGSIATETPHFYITKEKPTKARDALVKLRCTDNVLDELENMSRNIKADKEGNIMDLFKKKSNIKALFISTSLVIFQMFSGINIVLFFAETIFDATGTKIPPEISSIIIGVTQFITSFITPLFVDKLGRKFLLIFSAIGMILFEVPLGIYFYLQGNGTNVDNLFWMPITCLIFYIITYNAGFGPLPWTVMAEIFPANVKSLAASITAATCWLMSFFLTKYIADMAAAVGMAGSFWIFSGCNVVALIFLIFVLPETKGKSFAEIQEILSK